MISNILQIYFFLMNFNFWPMLKKCYPSPQKIEPTHLFLDPEFCIGNLMISNILQMYSVLFIFILQ